MANREKGKLSIRDVLKERDETLYSKTMTLWAEARELQERQKSKEEHQQGTLHCLEVEKNLGKLISDEDKRNRFTPLELFLLSATACYHDAGKSGEFKEGHGKVVAEDILLYPEKYGVDEGVGSVLYYIIGSHDDDEIFDKAHETDSIGSEDVQVKLLSALFRLADVLHTDYSRTPRIIVGDDVRAVDNKTRFRKLVRGWGFEDDSKIILTAVPKNSEDYNVISKGVSMMQDQIERTVPVLRDERYPYEIVYFCDDKIFRIKSEKESKRKIIGMDYYTEDDADIFKGRDRESEELQRRVVGSNISLLIGNSGVGKTSLIQAGLFPILNRMGWERIWTRPMNPDPLKYILNDINAKLPLGRGSDDIISSIKELSDECSRSDAIIVIDQFEDILRSPAPAKETIGKTLLRIYGMAFKNVHILLSYRGDYEPEINSFLNRSGVDNPRRFPLIGLETSVVSEVLRNIFGVNNVGISDELLGRIVQELEKDSEQSEFYPPFIQIVSSSLIDLAKSNECVITEDIYNNYAISVENIIGTYLMKRLDEFGDINSIKRRNAEEILKELVRDGEKEQKGRYDLERYLDISGDELQGLLDALVGKRLIRRLDNDNYEIIHDYLASRVEEMIKDDERLIRSARDLLRAKTQHYQLIPTPSPLQPNEMSLLYLVRRSIKPTIQEKKLLMLSHLAGKGPVWWWFRDDEEASYRTMILESVSNDIPEVRRAAVETLAKLGTHDDLGTVKEMLKDPDGDVRSAVFETLAKLGTHDDLEAIREMLKDRNWEVRIAAVETFAKLGTHEDLGAVKGMLKDPDGDVKSAANRAFAKLATHDDFETVKGMLKDPDGDMRSAANQTFAKLATHDDLRAVKEMLKDPKVRSAANRAFAKLATHDDFETVKGMPNDPDEDVRSAAVETLVKLGTPDDLGAVKKILKDPNRKVRRAVAGAFAKLATPDDIGVAKEMLKDPNWEVRIAAVETLAKLGTHDDLGAVKEMLKDPNRKVRRAVAWAFTKLATHDDLKTVNEMLKDADLNVRGAIVETLVKLGTHDDLEAIREMLKDRNPIVRIAAVETLVKLGAHEDLGVVNEMLKDPDRNVRRTAFDAFVKLVTHDNLGVVKGMLKDPDRNVRRIAFDAFVKLGTHDDLRAVKEMLSDPDRNVRKTVFNCILELGNENDLDEIATMYAKGGVVNPESLECIIALDEKFYSPFKTPTHKSSST
jgi:HEAT repeat protein